LNNAPPVVSSDIVINRFNGYFWLKEILDMALIDAGRHAFGNEQQTGTCRRITVVPNAAPKF
jgi:hypothetical protein